MLELSNLQFVRGINPNLAAGQRSIVVRGDNTASPYTFCQVPHNVQFYNFGTGPFTIYLRFLTLDNNVDRGYGENLPLMSKSANGHGWSVNLRDFPARMELNFARYGGYFGLRDSRTWPIDGFFHSIVFMRGPQVNNTPGDIRIFRDGVEVIATREQFSGIPDFDELNNNGVNLGGINFQFMRGYIDAAAFFTNDLTVQEVAALDTPARPDRGCKFLLDFNQLNAASNLAFDSTSVGQNGELIMSQIDKDGRGFVRTEGIRTFRKNSVLMPPLNGWFSPEQPTRIVGISRYDDGLTAAEYSLDGSTWIPISFDATNMSNNLPAFIEVGTPSSPTLYLRATNPHPRYLNALELHY